MSFGNCKLHTLIYRKSHSEAQTTWRVIHSGTCSLPVRVITRRNYYQQEFEDTERAISWRISKKNRQHNGQKKKCKRTNNDQQNMHIKLKIE